jgi:hypothetical protein
MDEAGRMRDGVKWKTVTWETEISGFLGFLRMGFQSRIINEEIDGYKKGLILFLIQTCSLLIKFLERKKAKDTLPKPFRDINVTSLYNSHWQSPLNTKWQPKPPAQPHGKSAPLPPKQPGTTPPSSTTCTSAPASPSRLPHPSQQTQF